MTLKEADKELKNTVETLFRRLGNHAAASTKSKILDRELTGRREPMVLNSAYLIQWEEIAQFMEEAESISREIQTKGFYLEWSGPWPR